MKNLQHITRRARLIVLACILFLTQNSVYSQNIDLSDWGGTCPCVLPDAYEDATPYQYVFTAAGGGASYTWTHVNGTLPDNMRFTQVGNDFVLQNYPETFGKYEFTIRVDDGVSSGDEETFILYAFGGDIMEITPDDAAHFTNIGEAVSPAITFIASDVEGSAEWSLEFETDNPGTVADPFTIGSASGDLIGIADVTTGSFLVDIIVEDDGRVYENGSPGDPDYEIRKARTTLLTAIVVQEPDREANIDVVYVLDKSGSMRSTVDDERTVRKWDLVASSVGQMTEYLKDPFVVESGDMVGAVFFSSSTSHYGDGSLQAMEDLGLSDFVLTLGTMDVTGSTGMGRGILDGLDYFSEDEGKIHHIILQSDGMQNRDPMVEYDPVVSINGKHLSEENVVIHTFVIGPPSLSEDLLPISDATGGSNYNIASKDAVADVDALFTMNFIEILRDLGSPQLVDFRYADYVGPAEQTINIDKNVRRVFFKLNWFNALGNLSLSVEKDGTDLTGYNTHSSIDGQTHQIYAVDLPLTLNDGSVIESEGEWKLNISRKTGYQPALSVPISTAYTEAVIVGLPGSPIPYQLSAIVDDHKLDYDVELSKAKYSINDTIGVTVDLSYSGILITEDVDVKAAIQIPGGDLGTLLSTTPTPVGEPSEEGVLPGETKYDLLMQDSAFVAELKRSEGEFESLENHGDGTYSIVFDNIEVTGYYKVVVKIEGENSTSGKFERTEIVTPLVVFGQVDEDNSEMHLMTMADGSMALYILPRSSSGLYLGPLYGDQISVTTPDGSAGPAIDQLDGSYLLPLTAGLLGLTAEIDVVVKGEKLYEGKVSRWGPVEASIWFYIILIIIFIILIWRYLANQGTIAKIPKWLLILLLIILIILWILNQLGVIAI